MPTSTIDLDRTTPKWPEALINLSAPARITVGGLTTVLTSPDVRAEAVDLVAQQAAAYGHPIRAKATTDDGWTQRMIVTEAGEVVLIGKPPPAAPPPKPGKKKAAPAAPIERAAGRFGTVPGWFRWVIIGVVAALVLAVLVLVLHRRPDPTPGAAPPPPIPPPGEVYTQTPPAGWSTHAAWVVPLAPRSPAPVTDPVTGYTAALTPTDQSAPGLGPFDENDLFLSALAPDGHTAWAAPLDGKPVLGPVLATIDGVETVVIVATRTATYWPLTGGQPTVVDLPTGVHAAAKNPGTGVLFTVGQTRAGYLSAGTVQVVDVLPLTKPLAAVDGAVLQWQQDNHAWWRVSAGTPPRRVTVTPTIAAAVLPPVHVKPVPGQLIPTGRTADLLMVVTAGRLYALTKER